MCDDFAYRTQGLAIERQTDVDTDKRLERPQRARHGHPTANWTSVPSSFSGWKSSHLIGTTGKGWAARRSLSRCPSVSVPISDKARYEARQQKKGGYGASRKQYDFVKSQNASVDLVGRLKQNLPRRNGQRGQVEAKTKREKSTTSIPSAGPTGPRPPQINKQKMSISDPCWPRSTPRNRKSARRARTYGASSSILLLLLLLPSPAASFAHPAGLSC